MELTAYLNHSIGHLFRDAIFSSRFNAKELYFLNQAAKAQKMAAQKRLRSGTHGISIPPFLIASIAARCNLHCAGCYARANHACADEPVKEEIGPEKWGELFSEADALGVSFILLAGGEPLERPDVLDEAAKRPKLIFPVFTNGTLFAPAMLERFDRHRNLVPVISIEGDRRQTDSRRGEGVFETVRQTMERMSRLGLFYGVSITVTKENLGTVTEDAFVSGLNKMGCRLVFLVEYVPADGNAAPALEEKDRLVLEARQNALKAHYPGMIILSFPGDEKEMGGCLAAGRGFFHINASGDAEPCPFSPYSDTNLRHGHLQDALGSVLFRQIRENNENNNEAQSRAGGCALFSRKTEIESLLQESQ